MISGGGDIAEIILARIKCGWKKFQEHLSVFTSKLFSLFHERQNIPGRCQEGCSLCSLQYRSNFFQ